MLYVESVTFDRFKCTGPGVEIVECRLQQNGKYQILQAIPQDSPGEVLKPT